MTSDVVLSSALRGTLLSLNRSEDTIDNITGRLASGLDVGSAVDNPQNFFTAQALRNVASDSGRLLDGIGQSIRTIEEAANGVEALDNLIDQAEAVVSQSRDALQAGDVDPAVFSRTVNTSPPPLSTQVIAAGADVNFRLDGGAAVDNGVAGAGVGTTFQGGAGAVGPALYSNGAGTSIDFDGINDGILVADSPLINTTAQPERTIHLVFNADTTTGRQVLYEEGAGVNGLTIYIDNGLIRVTGEDDQGGQRFADLDISAPIVAGQTYTVALVFDGPNATFEGFLDGQSIGQLSVNTEGTFPSHSGNIGIGRAVDGVQFHDGESGAGFQFDGQISDVSIFNRALDATELDNFANSLNATTSEVFENQEYNTILEQIDRIVIDAQYRGLNLLNGETLRTDFNSTRTNFLETEGQDFTALGLGLSLRSNFTDIDVVNDILEQIRNARTQVRQFGFTLANELSIIQTREIFTAESVNTNSAAADDLTVSDQNRDGAELLAAQTRLALGVVSLGLAGQSQASILQLF